MVSWKPCAQSMFISYVIKQVSNGYKNISNFNDNSYEIQYLRCDGENVTSISTPFVILCICDIHSYESQGMTL